jgi:hypothetical protein
MTGAFADAFGFFSCLGLRTSRPPLFLPAMILSTDVGMWPCGAPRRRSLERLKPTPERGCAPTRPTLSRQCAEDSLRHAYDNWNNSEAHERRQEAETERCHGQHAGAMRPRFGGGPNLGPHVGCHLLPAVG